MRRALFVTAVVRKMNLYPMESKAPASVTKSRSRAPSTSHVKPSGPRSRLDQTQTHQRPGPAHDDLQHSVERAPCYPPTARPASGAGASRGAFLSPAPCPPHPTFCSLLPFSLPRKRRAEISENVQPPRNTTKMRRKDSLEALSSLVTSAKIRADARVRRGARPHPLSAPAPPARSMPRTCERQLAAVEQPQHLVQTLPAPPLQHLGGRGRGHGRRFQARDSVRPGKGGRRQATVASLVSYGGG